MRSAVLAVMVLAAALILPVSSAPASAAVEAHLEGVYVVTAVDPPAHQGGEAFIQELKVGARYYRLHSQDLLPFKTGQSIAVEGPVTRGEVDVVTARPLTPAPRAAAAAASGTMHILVMLVYWTSPDSVTQSSAQQQVGAADDYWYDQASYGLQGTAASATPWMSIADPFGGSCNFNQLASEADQAATAKGYNLSDYDHFMYYFPQDSTCSWGGAGNMGGPRTWINGAMTTRVTVHELGHNLGLGHSNRLVCQDEVGAPVPLSGECTEFAYGDFFSFMGGTSADPGMPAASMSASLGWLGQGSHLLETVDTPGSHLVTLTPIENGTGGTQAIKVVDLTGRSPDLWVEYRQSTGIDSWIGSGGTGGVLVHAGSGLQSTLLDMTPGSQHGFLDAALPFGTSWTNPLNGVTVQVGMGTGTGVEVTVFCLDLAVSKAGTGSGTVTSSPQGIDCGATCWASFGQGSTVVLTAIPDPGSSFSGWSGACTGTGACSVTIGPSKYVGATFADATPPDTTIDSGPSGRVDDSSATFTFSGSDPGGSGVASFSCRLDSGSWGACTSPNAYTSLADGGHTFEVKATDAAGNTDPTPAQRTWWIGPPTNDSFSSPFILSGTSASRTGDTNVGATRETGEPAHAQATGGHSVWYRWKPANPGATVIDTCGSDFDTVLGVYAGSSVDALTEVASNDDSSCGDPSQVSFTATGGTTYQIAVDGYYGNTGSIDLNLSQVNGTFQPDAQVKGSTDPAFLGDGTYNSTGASQTRTLKALPGKTALFNLKIENDGTQADWLALSGPSSVSGFRASYRDGASIVTSQVAAGTYSTGTLAPGASVTISIAVKVPKNAKPRTGASFLLTATSQADPARKDAVKATAKAK